MKRVKYSKYVPDPAGEMSIEDLLSTLSDYLLQSGFQNDMQLPGERKALPPTSSIEVAFEAF